MMRFVVDALGFVPQIHGQEDLETKGRIETIQTPTLLRSASMQRRVLGDVIVSFLCFNIVSTFMGFFNAKTILVEEWQW